MSELRPSSIQPVQPLSGAQPVHAVRAEPDQPKVVDPGLGVAAVTGGSLPPAYSEFVVNSDTRDIVLQVKDASTNAVISQYPSREVEAMAAYLNTYAAMLARRHAAQQTDRTPRT